MLEQDEQAEILKYLLGQIYRSEKRKKQLDDRLEAIRARRQSPIGTSGYSSMPNNHERDGAASILFRISDIEDRIYQQKQEIENAIVRVMDIIDYLPLNSIEREICELRHIDLKTWSAISAEIPMSRSQVNRRYNVAIDILLNQQRIRKMIAKHEEEYLTWKMTWKIGEQKKKVKNTGGNIKSENKSGKISGKIIEKKKIRK